MDRLAAGDDSLRIAARTRQVHDRYRRTIQKVYRRNAQLFLDHTNSVYIMDKKGVKTLIVYMDESIFAAELNAQRELIRLHMHQMFGEDVQVFEIHVSRGSYKKQHPFSEMDDDGIAPATDECDEVLSADKRKFVEETVAAVGDARLRASLEKAMTADLKRRKEEK